jgi:hypothetical protein
MEMCHLRLSYLVVAAALGRTLDWNLLVSSLRIVRLSITKKTDCALHCEAKRSCLDCFRTAELPAATAVGAVGA